MDILTNFLSQDGRLWLAIILFLVGLGLIIKGGDLFVDSSSWMATASGIPKFIIGATIVSFATTLPELLVSTFATIGGSYSMATGNAIGSVTANTGLIMAISLFFMPSKTERKELIFKTLFLISALLLMFIFAVTSNGSIKGDGTLNVFCSVLLFAIFTANMVENVFVSKKSQTLEPKLAESEEKKEKVPYPKKEVIKNILFFVLGAIGIIIGAELLVETATVIATKLSIPESVIGLTIVAVGTSLPELVTTITAIIKKEHSLSVGNIIGANIIDLTLILSICSFISGGKLILYEQNILLDIPVCLLEGAIALVPTLITKKFTRLQGIILLAVYITYIVLVTIGVDKIGLVPAV